MVVGLCPWEISKKRDFYCPPELWINGLSHSRRKTLNIRDGTGERRILFYFLFCFVCRCSFFLSQSSVNPLFFSYSSFYSLRSLFCILLLLSVLLLTSSSSSFSLFCFYMHIIKPCQFLRIRGCYKPLINNKLIKYDE